MQFVVIGAPGDRRIELFQQALDSCQLSAAQLVSYSELLKGNIHLSQVVQHNTVVRIESPGRDFDIEKVLLHAGAAEADSEPYAHLAESAIADLSFDRGRLRFPRQWYLGFTRALRLIGIQLTECPPHQIMNHPNDIALMFDKAACHAVFSAHGLPVPRSLNPIYNFDTLIDAMQREHCFRVFVKLAHGSSASGTVAYEWSGDRHRAITTVEVVWQGGQITLYNSRHLRTIFDLSEIRTLIDALCQHNVHVEQWIPKAAHHNKVFDLRVVTIKGAVRHTIVRLSKTPMTNLHLLNERASVEQLERMPIEAWHSAQETCQHAAGLFPRSLYSGIDLMFEPGYRRHHILEINAFGDLLPGLLDRGQSTYEAEIEAVLERAKC
jgi:hypothetical protein